MNPDKILDGYFPVTAPVPEPVNALLLLEAPDGTRSARLCFSRAQILEARESCPRTTAAVWKALSEDLEESILPKRSTLAAIDIKGWVGAYLGGELGDDAPIRYDDLQEFVEEVDATCLLIVPEPGEEGDAGIIASMNVAGHFRVWVMPSRSAVRQALDLARDCVEPEDHAAIIARLDEACGLPEQSSRQTLLIEGYVAGFITTMLHCRRTRRERLDGLD